MPSSPRNSWILLQFELQHEQIARFGFPHSVRDERALMYLLTPSTQASLCPKQATVYSAGKVQH